jgi:bifunctional isochorismate lyase/aryl carrier protein
MTLDEMRADIADMIGEDPAEIGADNSLIDLGLDSIRAMMLVERWKAAGLALEFAALAETPTLGHWWSIAERKLAAG